MRYALEGLLSQGRISESQLNLSFCTRLLPQQTPPDVAGAALGLLLAARARVPNLEAVFEAARAALLQQAAAGKPVGRCLLRASAWQLLNFPLTCKPFQNDQKNAWSAVSLTANPARSG